MYHTTILSRAIKTRIKIVRSSGSPKYGNGLWPRRSRIFLLGALSPVRLVSRRGCESLERCVTLYFQQLTAITSPTFVRLSLTGPSRRIANPSDGTNDYQATVLEQAGEKIIIKVLATSMCGVRRMEGRRSYEEYRTSGNYRSTPALSHKHCIGSWSPRHRVRGVQIREFHLDPSFRDALLYAWFSCQASWWFRSSSRSSPL